MESSVLPIPKHIQHIFEAACFHYGVVKCVSDPKDRGRCLVECPAIFDDGEDNWTGWAEYVGLSHGGIEGKGDSGIWWPPVPGQLVIVGFEGGSMDKPFYLPAGPWRDDNKSFLPKDVVNRIEGGGKSTQMRVIKSPYGHTICMDDNPNEEGMYICDWTGSGMYWMNPSKDGNLPQTEQCKESKGKTGGNREDKLAMASTAADPSELTQTGEVTTGFCDVNGQGWMCRAKSGAGMMAMWTGEGFGDMGCSMIMDTADQAIILTAGEVQLRLDGKLGAIYATKQMVWEVPYDDSLIDSIKRKLENVKDFFKGLYCSE